MRKICIGGVLFLSAVLLSCHRDVKKTDGTASQLERLVGTSQFLAIQESVEVTAKRVAFGKGGDVAFAERGAVLPEGEAGALKAFLLDDANYILGRNKKAVFIPEIAYFFRGKERVVVLVSTLSSQVRLIGRDETHLLDIDPMARAFAPFSLRHLLTLPQVRKEGWE